jgi:hypothetical protein
MSLYGSPARMDRELRRCRERRQQGDRPAEPDDARAGDEDVSLGCHALPPVWKTYASVR